MDKHALMQFLPTQIEVYEVIIKRLESLLKSEVLNEFDGKVINKKITDAVNAFNKDTFLKEKSNIYINIDKTYAGQLTRYMEVIVRSSVYFNAKYPYSADKDLKIEIEFESKYFDLRLFTEKIESVIEKENQKVAQLKYELENIDTIIEEFEKIASQITEFNKKYSNEVRTDMRYQKVY